MGRTLKPPRVSKLAEVEAKRMAKLSDPVQIAVLAAKAQRRLERAKRFADQAQHQIELKAKREARAAAKALKDERLAAKAALTAQAQAKRQARAEKRAGIDLRRQARVARRAGVDSRRQARLNRQKEKEEKWVARAEKEEKAYQWRQRKAEIADFKEHRLKYLEERKRLARENPWALVLEQEELVELAYRRKLLLRQDERGAKSVMGADDPETILEWHRLKKGFRSASNSWQHEKRKLLKLTLAAREFDERRADPDQTKEDEAK